MFDDLRHFILFLPAFQKCCFNLFKPLWRHGLPSKYLATSLKVVLLLRGGSAWLNSSKVCSPTRPKIRVCASTKAQSTSRWARYCSIREGGRGKAYPHESDGTAHISAKRASFFKRSCFFSTVTSWEQSERSWVQSHPRPSIYPSIRPTTHSHDWYKIKGLQFWKQKSRIERFSIVKGK